MNVIMNIQQTKTLKQVRQFLISTADTIIPPSYLTGMSAFG
jgi:hypothetical protein